MQLALIAHNIRSTHNIGSILRTADGFGVAKVFLTGYTPYPTEQNDARLPHLRQKITRQIHKTALGAEETVAHEHRDDVIGLLQELSNKGFQIVALEQHKDSQSIDSFVPKGNKLALLLGEEVHGIEAGLLTHCNAIVEIPMHGKKESFNVSVAAAISLYVLSKL